ncbi:MAG: hypothetical protein IJE26_02475 [Oscillospiraceae bacterium]|nr:hypothetical protein [Oscillospiraceae bacterium]
MKNKFSFVLAYLCLLALLTIGVGELLFAEKETHQSHTENRMLQGFPELSQESFFSGEFMDDFESFLSDGFFGRDGVVSASQSVLALFSLPDTSAPSADQGDAQLVEMKEEDADSMLAQLAEATPAPQESETGVVPANAQDAALYMINPDGSKQVSQAYTADKIARLAEVLNTYRDALPEDGSVHYTNIPISNLANAITLTERYSGWESTVDDALQPLVKDGVYIYDTPEILGPMIRDEYIYYTMDFHWTPLGASRLVDAMVKRQGLQNVGYYEYLYRLASEYDGANYDRQALLDKAPHRDDVQVQVPMSPVEANIITHLTERSPCPYLLDVDIDHYDKYHLYLTGVVGPWRRFETGYNTGRTAMVVGDCFNTVLVPYLAPYYDAIMMTDFRDEYYKPTDAGANARAYIEHYGIDDLYVVSCTWSPVDGYMLQDRLLQYLDLEYED